MNPVRRAFPVRLSALACIGGALVSGCGGKAESQPDNGPARSFDRDRPIPLAPDPRRQGETCDDNPLLAGCQSTSVPSAPDPRTQGETCDDNPLLVGCPPVAIPADPAPASYAPYGNTLPGSVQRAELILESNCGSCHGAQWRRGCDSRTCEGLNYIDSVQLLVESDKVLPCRWEESFVAKRIADGSMPPSTASQPPMSRADQQQLESFVNGICDSLTGVDADRDRLFVERTLRENCADCHGAPGDAGPPPGGLARVDDIAALIGGGFLLPCNSSASPIVQVLRAGSMPPVDSPLVPLSGTQIAAIAAFIDRPCRR